MHLKIFDICRRGTHVLGPGNRYVIWVQGCDRRCPGCITPESHSFDNATEIHIDDLAADIILAAHIDGITISGGEPFLQSQALCALLQKVRRSRPELSVIIYTGNEYLDLLKDTDSKKLIDCADVIIDGRYIESLNDNKGIRGSSNQKIILVTPRLKDYAHAMENSERRIMRVIEPDGKVTSVGVPSAM
ncbi:MAG: radical SAM protein [Muribaculaceae bacterium]|nr:radical SAM protein [Muribaculaceae bacterium]MDE6134210.1 radical SAM protein [Muribaculaceae bacterium]